MHAPRQGPRNNAENADAEQAGPTILCSDRSMPSPQHTSVIHGRGRAERVDVALFFVDTMEGRGRLGMAPAPQTLNPATIGARP